MINIFLPPHLGLRRVEVVGMEHPGGPVELVGVQLQGEASLRVVTCRQVQVVKLVDVTRVHLLPVDLILVKVL